MNQDELFRALDGLHAYDTGCTDSGIKDELLRARVVAYFEVLPEDEISWIITRFLTEDGGYLSEEGIRQGYGIEDAHGFLRWFHEDLFFR